MTNALQVWHWSDLQVAYTRTMFYKYWSTDSKAERTAQTQHIHLTHLFFRKSEELGKSIRQNQNHAIQCLIS